MIKEIDVEKWDEIYKTNSISIFFNPEYIDTQIKSFKLQVKYYSFFEKNNFLLLIAVFIRNNQIVLPDNYSYTPYWMSPCLNDRKKIAIQKELILSLKKLYNKITFKFNIETFDIRPYKWAEFSIDVKYTYIKNTCEGSDATISKALKKVDPLICIKINEAIEESIMMNLIFLEKLGFGGSKINSYRSYLNKLSDKNMIVSFETYYDNKLIGAQITLLDKDNSKGFALLSTPISHKFKNAHSLMYQKRNEWLEENNFMSIDFGGANMESISNFKTYFNPELRNYYIAKYDNRSLNFLLKRLLTTKLSKYIISISRKYFS